MHEDRIEALSQLGLVFLMFSIGLDLSVGKLRRMGIGIVLAVAFGAILVFNIVRSDLPVSRSQLLLKASLWLGCWWRPVPRSSEKSCRKPD